jgi:PAS domain S-box-containing protein
MTQNYQADNDSITGLLRAITQAQSYFISDVKPRILFEELLSNLLILTKSEYGFIGEIRHRQNNIPYLKTHAITNIAWNEETRKFYEDNIENGLEFDNLNTLFGKVITTGEPVISNDPYHDPRRGGLPEGHPPLNAFLGLPFYQSNRLIGMVGIANRKGGYDEQMIHYLQPFLATCANIIEAYRVNKQRLQIENALRDSESKNRAILKTMIGSIIVIDSKGIVEFFNPAAEEIFGYSADDIIGHNVNRLMPEPYNNEHDTYLNNYLTTGQRKVIGIGREVVAKRKDGSLFPIELAVNEMKEGDELKFVGRIIDMTERKAAEQALIKAKEQAEESNRLKSEFLNVISHELRTPLTIMLGNLPLLTDPDDLPETDEIADIAKDIEDSGRHLLALINDLLDLSKIEAGKMTIQKELLSVATLTQDVITSVKIMAFEKNVMIKTEIDDIEVFADPIRLKQILLNLLGNAVKFTENGFIKVKIKPMAHQVHFSIEDTGCGIDEQDIPLIFNAFRQSDSSVARRADGTGLGLAITKKLVELHNGEISVKSQLGKGSVFSFSIPKHGVVKIKKNV